MTENNDVNFDDAQLTAAAKAAEAVKALQRSCEDVLNDQHKDGPPNLEIDTGLIFIDEIDTIGSSETMLPLTLGRATLESFLSLIQPFSFWSANTHTPFVPAWPVIENWNRKVPTLDEDGNPMLDTRGEPIMEFENPIRRKWYPHGGVHFVSQERFEQYQQAIINAAEPMYLTLFAIRCRQRRWDDESVEEIIATDPFWNCRYLDSLPPLDPEDDDDQSLAYTGNHRSSLMPITPGRVYFDSFYLRFCKPFYLYSAATEYPHVPAWPIIENWNRKVPLLDKDGNPKLDTRGDPIMEFENPIRRKWYPHGGVHFVSQERFEQYQQAIINAAEPMYLALFAIHCRQMRWKDKSVEEIIATDPFWNRRYLADLPPLDPDEDDGGEQSGTLRATGDGGTPPSSPGLASVEA